MTKLIDQSRRLRELGAELTTASIGTGGLHVSIGSIVARLGTLAHEISTSVFGSGALFCVECDVRQRIGRESRHLYDISRTYNLGADQPYYVACALECVDAAQAALLSLGMKRDDVYGTRDEIRSSALSAISCADQLLDARVEPDWARAELALWHVQHILKPLTDTPSSPRDFVSHLTRSWHVRTLEAFSLTKAREATMARTILGIARRSMEKESEYAFPRTPGAASASLQGIITSL